MGDQRTLPVWQWRPIVFFALGMLSVVTFAAAYQASQEARINSAVTGAIERIMIKATTAHLWFEQAMAGGEGGDFKDIRTDLDDSIRLASVILDGGESERGVMLNPLTDADLRTGVEKVRSLLTDFRALVLLRCQEPKGSPSIPIQDQNINATFREFQNKAISLGLLLEKDQSRGRSRNLFSGILVIWAFTVVATTTVLWRRGRRRREAQSALGQSEESFRVTLAALKNKAALDEREKYRSNLEAIFRSVRDAVVMVDRDLVVVEVNEAAKEICGLSREVVGKPFVSLQPGCAGCFDALRETIEKREAVDAHNLECRAKDGSRRIVSLTTSPLKGAKGEFSGAVLVVRDDTRLDDLERNLRERQQFHNIIGESEKMQEIYPPIEDLANAQTTELISREGSTGMNALSPDSGGVSEEELPSFPRDKHLTERMVILSTLEESSWNKARAARLLGISKRTICRKIKEYNILNDRS